MGAGGGAGAGQMFGTVLGIAQYLQASKEANNLKNDAKRLENSRPKLKRDVLGDQNLDLVKSELANGMSSEAEKAYTDLNDKQFSSSLSALLRGGGNVNSVGDIYGANQEGNLKLSMMQDSNRLNQVKNVLDQSEYVDQRNVISPFQVNDFSPWRDKAMATGIAREAAEKKKNDSLNSVISGVSGSTAGSGLSSGMGGGGSTGGSGMNYANLISSTGQVSDKRLKHNYYVVGESKSGINIYEFSYNGSSERYVGVMAQEVPQAAFEMDNGFMAVDYSKIDVEFKKL